MKDGDLQFFDVDTPRNVSRVVPLVTIAAGQRLTLAVCSPKVHGRVTHWLNDRTRPCMAHRGECPCLERDVPTRDRGYLLVANTQGQIYGWIDLTPMAFEQLRVLAEKRGTLRGLILLFMRRGKTAQSRLVIEEIGEYSFRVPLPDDRSPDPTLARVWGVGS